MSSINGIKSLGNTCYINVIIQVFKSLHLDLSSNDNHYILSILSQCLKQNINIDILVEKFVKISEYDNKPYDAFVFLDIFDLFHQSLKNRFLINQEQSYLELPILQSTTTNDPYVINTSNEYKTLDNISIQSLLFNYQLHQTLHTSDIFIIRLGRIVHNKELQKDIYINRLISIPLTDFYPSVNNNDKYTLNCMILYHPIGHQISSKMVGHYTIILKHNDLWYEIDDDYVLLLKDQPKHIFQSKNAYILYYIKA